MYKRILVAIDDSQMAEGALQEALALAKLHGAQVRVVHAVESPSIRITGPAQCCLHFSSPLGSDRRAELARCLFGYCELSEVGV